jgi:hypothetical protein
MMRQAKQIREQERLRLKEMKEKSANSNILNESFDELLDKNKS